MADRLQDPGLRIRARAARHAIRQGALTPDLALSYAVWPTSSLRRLTETLKP